MDAIIIDSAMSLTRRLDASGKKEKIACPLLDVFACGKVSSPRMYRLIVKICFEQQSFLRIFVRKINIVISAFELISDD